MAIGVSYHDFWHGEPEIVRYTIEKTEIVQRNEAIDADVLAWNTGRYVLLAVGTLMSEAFSKGGTKAQYPLEPMMAAELDEQLARQRRERELRQAHADFLAVAAALSSKTGEPN